MAIQQDFDMYADCWMDWSTLTPDPIRKIILCSGNIRQLKLLRSVAPMAQIYEVDRSKWDLNTSAPLQADVIVACNVFHYSSNPVIWFNHIFGACRYFWMQDLFARRRGFDGEFGNDGDCIRYGFGAIPGCTDRIFDMDCFREKVLDYRVYDAGSMQNKRATINFVACFRGDLP